MIFPVICRRILYSGAKDQMMEEREGRRVLFGIHKDDFSVICRRILYSGAKDQMVEYIDDFSIIFTEDRITRRCGC